MSTRLRIFLVMMLGNLGGALLVFVHLRYFDPFALDEVAALGWSEVVFFIVAFSVLLLGGRVVARRYILPVVRIQGVIFRRRLHQSTRHEACCAYGS